MLKCKICKYSRKQQKQYMTHHFLDTLGTDHYSSYVSIFLEIEAGVQDMVQTVLLGGDRVAKPIEDFQIGRKFDNLDLVPYCDPELHCDQNLKHTTTSKGLCNVLFGQNWEPVVNKNDDLHSHLKRMYSFPDAMEQKTYSYLRNFNMLFDIHNTDLKEPYMGQISIKFGHSKSYINQV